MSLPRFYVHPANCDPDEIHLDDAESHHAHEVLRLREDTRVVVFNGEGTEWTAEIIHASKRETILRAIHSHRSPALPARITLAQAIPKGKNMELILQKATELGAAEIIPLISERTIVRLDASERTDRRDKWQRTTIEACKQCGQNWLPTVHAPVPMDQFFASRPNADLNLIAAIDPDARRLKSILADAAASSPNPIRNALVLIGPEGDFTPAEYGLARSHGCLPLSLGPIILRTETAAIYSISILAHELM